MQSTPRYTVEYFLAVVRAPDCAYDCTPWIDMHRNRKPKRANGLARGLVALASVLAAALFWIGVAGPIGM